LPSKQEEKMLEQLVSVGRGGEAMKTFGFSDVRAGPRIRVALPVRLRFGWNNSQEVNASSLDMSERGLCVRQRAPLREGIEVKAIFESTPDDVKVYRVVWVHEAKSFERAFDIGLELKL
jgi:hypothetical protein